MERITDLFNRLKETPQPPQWHPEGSVWNHTVIVFHHFYMYNNKWFYSMPLAALFHDVGKADTTVVKEDKITAHGHEAVSDQLFLDYAKAVLPLTHPIEIEITSYIIRHHMRIKKLDEMRPKKVADMIEESDEIFSRVPKDVYGDDRIFMVPFQNLILFRDADKMVGERDTGLSNIFKWQFDNSVTGEKFLLAERRMTRLIEMLQKQQDLYERMQLRGTYDEAGS